MHYKYKKSVKHHSVWALISDVCPFHDQGIIIQFRSVRWNGKKNITKQNKKELSLFCMYAFSACHLSEKKGEMCRRCKLTEAAGMTEICQSMSRQYGGFMTSLNLFNISTGSSLVTWIQFSTDLINSCRWLVDNICLFSDFQVLLEQSVHSGMPKFQQSLPGVIWHRLWTVNGVNHKWNMPNILGIGL